MYKHILVPTDGSELSRKAIEHAIALAKITGARVTGIMVSTPFYIFAGDLDLMTQEQYSKSIVAVAKRYLDQVKQIAAAADVPCDVIHAEEVLPHQGILDAAKYLHCDLIVMASHGRRGLSAVVLGSETVKVLTHSSVPVLVYR